MSWNIDMPNTDYFCIDDVGTDRFNQFINEATAQPQLAIDTETTGLVKWKDIPLYFSLAWGGRRATLHANVLQYFSPLFKDPTKEWVFANAKYDAHILANVGHIFAGKLVCTQVMHSLLYEDKPHKLKYMAQHLLGWTWADFQDQFGKIGARNSAEDVIRRAERENMGLLIEYAANDAWGTWHVFKTLEQQLQAAPTHSLFSDKPPYINTLWDFYNKIEKPYTKVLWKMEREGIKIDQERLARAAPEAQEAIHRLEKDIYKLVGYALNPSSSAQLQKYFFEQEKLTPIKFTKGGKSGVRQPSVDSDVLEQLQYEHPVAKLIMERNGYAKLLSTYITGLSSVVDPHGRIHTSFQQDVARTGRLSSRDPALQNIPRPENDRWGVREAFIAEGNNLIFAFDYDQLEMRLVAAAAMEQDMIAIFEKKWDIHMGNASMMFGIPYDDLKSAKNIDKQVKEGALNPDALTDYVRKCLDARRDSKAIGFGQPVRQAEVKPTQNGEAYRLAA